MPATMQQITDFANALFGPGTPDAQLIINGAAKTGGAYYDPQNMAQTAATIGITVPSLGGRSTPMSGPAPSSTNAITLGAGGTSGAPYEGQIKTVNGITARYTNGQWVQVASAGAATSPTSSAVPAGNDGLSPNVLAETVYDPYTAFRQSIGVGGKAYESPGQKYLLDQYTQLKSLYGMQQALAAQTSPYANQFTPYGSMVDYTGSLGQNAMGKYGAARNMLNTFMGGTQEQNAGAGFNFDPYTAVNEQTGESSMKTGNIGDLTDLIALASRNKYGTQGSRYMAGAVGRDAQIFRDQQLAASPGQIPAGNFLDYIKQKYNLGGF